MTPAARVALKALTAAVVITALSVAALVGWVDVKGREAAAKLERERVAATVAAMTGGAAGGYEQVTGRPCR